MFWISLFYLLFTSLFSNFTYLFSVCCFMLLIRVFCDVVVFLFVLVPSVFISHLVFLLCIFIMFMSLMFFIEYSFIYLSIMLYVFNLFLESFPKQSLRDPQALSTQQLLRQVERLDIMHSMILESVWQEVSPWSKNSMATGHIPGYAHQRN